MMNVPDAAIIQKYLQQLKKHGYAYDGDDVRCVECGLLGCVTLGGEDDDGDSFAYVSWDEFEDED